MPAVSASAPGKIILFGEHAVVYGQPAIAVPVPAVKARAVVNPDPRGEPGVVRIQAPDIGLDACLDDLPGNNPLRKAVEATAAALGISRLPALTLRVTSTIPVASGLGSGAAVSVAAVRALSAFLGHPLSDEQVSAAAFEVEKLHHGTPSGIDNTVITYALPVYFAKGQPLQTFRVTVPFTIVIGDTGISSPTSATVGDVRRAWEQSPEAYEGIFQKVGALVVEARRQIESGRPHLLGPLMDENHALLGEMGVSSSQLDELTAAARAAGALGSKLSGGGRGGNMIALAGSPEAAATIAAALKAAGAAGVLTATIE